jgi:hypothetical protein
MARPDCRLHLASAAGRASSSLSARHDAALARALRTAATAIPVHIAAGKPDRLSRAHAAAVRVHVMLLVAQAWACVPAGDLTDAQNTARRLEALTAPA